MSEAGRVTTVGWLQISIVTDRLHADRLVEILECQGAVSVSLQDALDTPVFEPLPGETPLWPDTEVQGLFEAGADVKAVQAAVAAATGDGAVRQWRVEPLADRVWEREWLSHFQPMRFGDRLWVCPSSFEAPDVDAINVWLDPGLAFGTGTHPTTALCLEWLDRHPPQGLDVLDFGCGSGILGIAALLLGARKVEAVDIDPQALQATRDNAAKNGVAERIWTGIPSELANREVDLALANILSGPLIELAPNLMARTARGGYLVLSGILIDQVEAVAGAYASGGYIRSVLHRDEWALIAVQRI